MQTPDGTATTPEPHARTLAWTRILRRLVAALVPASIVALPPLFWVIDATGRASLATLGRDQGIFQYIAWAVAHGAKDYRDVRDVNGPLTHLVHLVFLRLGGADEHRFRVLDLAITGATFALAGACLPGLGRRARSLGAGVRLDRLLERAAWGFAAWVVLSGQYLQYIFWDLAQRESFFDWFLLSSTALQLVAHAELRREGAVGARRLLAVAGALSVVTWFGKPTFALFTIAQVFVLAIDDDIKLPRRARFSAFAIGGAVGALTQLAYLLVYADIRAFLRIYLVDVPTMYRFIWPRSAVEIFSLPGVSTTAALSFVTSAAMVGLVVDRQMPRRALLLALFPLCGIGSVILQSKGFPYHFHPVSAGLHLQWLAIVVWLWEKSPLSSSLASRASRKRAPIGARMAPFLAASALALRVAFVMPLSPHIANLWILTKARDSEERASRDYLVYFQTYDFFPWEMRQTAAYLKEHTGPDDRVQMYGMDPYVLFLAERRSATPYIYAYDLNVDAALAGGQLPEPTGLHPNVQEQARILALHDEHEKDLLDRLQKAPPAAFVFVDKSPLITWQEAIHDFHEACPTAAAWVDANYVETAVFEVDHVWMRRDPAKAE